MIYHSIWQMHCNNIMHLTYKDDKTVVLAMYKTSKYSFDFIGASEADL